MESNACGTDNLPNESDSDNTNLNEATPATAPLGASDVPKDASASSNAGEGDDAISSTTPDKFVEELNPSTSNMIAAEDPTDADFFASELSITDVRTEKITENVEDIVQDLENLLGESNDSYRFGRESFDVKLTESFDEVNSSNVGDLVQQSVLYQTDEANMDGMELNASVVKDDDDVLPGDSIVATDNVISSDLSETIPLELPGTTSEVDDVPADVINELKDITEIETTTAVLDLVESTAENATNITLELNDIIPEVVPLEIVEQGGLAMDTDSTYDTASKDTDGPCALIFGGDDVEKAVEDCISNVEPISESETKMDIAEHFVNDEKVCEMDVVKEDSIMSINIADGNQISLNLDEELPVPIDLDVNMTGGEQPLENPVELLDKLVESANIPDDNGTGVDDLLDTVKDLSSNLDSEIVAQDIDEIKQQTVDECNASPEITQSVVEDQIKLPEVGEPSLEDVTMSVEGITEQRAEDLITLPEIVEAENEEQKVQEQEVLLKQQEEAERENKNEIIESDVEQPKQKVVLLEVEQSKEQEVILPEVEQSKEQEVILPEVEQSKEQEIILPEVEKSEEHEEILPEVEKSEEQEEICPEVEQSEEREVILPEMEQSEDLEGDALPKEKSNLVHEDVSMNMDDNASADVLPTTNEVFTEPDEPKTTELVQPLTVEVEDVTAVVAEVEKAEKVEPMEVTEAADIPANKVPSEDETESIVNRAPLKMTIAKHKSENVHSILKIYDPNEVHEEQHIPKLIIKSTPSSTTDPEEAATPEVIPKITIKPVLTPPESQHTQHSPKLTIKPIKQDLDTPRKSTSSGSPRITIKPVVKPETLSPLKVTLRPYPRCEDMPSSPKLNIKPIVKPTEDESHHSPKITIKPIIKPPDDVQAHAEERHSPRITIKPIIKPAAEEFIKSEESVQSPRITIKPIIKPQERDESDNSSSSPPMQQPFKLNIKPVVRPAESSLSPKITIKPIVKPPEVKSEPVELIDFEEQIKQERIVLKIAKNTKKAPAENEKLKKIKVKLSKEGGAHIVSRASLKRPASDDIQHESKYFKAESTSDLTISLVSNTATTTNLPDITITRVESTKTDFKQEDSSSNDTNAPVSIESIPSTTVSSSVSMEELPDPLADIPVFEITLETAAAMNSASKAPAPAAAASSAATPPAPRKRGRPRKVPLEVREEFEEPVQQVRVSTRPKRSCRGSSARATLGIKPRKPRAASQPRGAKRSVSTRATSARKSKEPKSPVAKTKSPKEPMIKEEPDFKEYEPKDAEFKQVPLPAAEQANTEVVMYEEETRMSAENSSRAQTPAKQVLVSSTEVIEESQSSIQSNTTTESGEKLQKSRKATPRLEVHQEPEGEVISADKLTEYSWGGGGPYMLQEQVAQFLGIKSFKRKYPGIQRRTVDMQERDFIRESCLASEAMCDMGLTAVRSEDILDIMYTDFQNKYEEYCKHQRDRQAKDVSNKQKALSLAASQEKTKLDIVEQAVQSAFQWNASFNKARREQRRACMDLQTFTVHFPRGKMKQVNKPPIGNYPLALVPGQFTDYYKKYSPYELSNLPLNTIGCKSVAMSQDTEESQSDASGSDSDSSSSDSDSSCSGSSGAEDCKMCRPAASKKVLVH